MSDFLAIYFPFYFIAVVLSIPTAIQRDLLQKYNDGYDVILTIFLGLACIFLFGFRNYDMGTDTQNYIDAFNQLQFASNFNEAINTRTAYSSKDPFFNIFTFYIGNWFGLRGYFVFLAIVYILPILFSTFYLVKTNRALIFVCFMGLIAFPNMGVNIIRSAASISCCVLSLTLFFRRNWVMGTIFFLLSVGFHFATIVVFLAGMVVLLPISLFIYILALLFFTMLAAKGVGVGDLPVIGDLILAQDRLSGYISGDRVTGSLSPFILVFFYGVLLFSLYYHYSIKDLAFSRFIKIYIILTIFYFMTLELNDSYRFSFFPSILAPVLVCYPVLNYKFDKNYNFILVGFMVLFIGLLSYIRTS